MGTAGRGPMAACWRGHAVALLCALLLAGCAGDRAENGPAGASSPSASASVVTTQAESAAPSATPVPSIDPVAPATAAPSADAVPSTTPTPPTEEAGAGVVLEPGGLGIVALGDPAEDVIAALSGVYGPPDEDTGWTAHSGECTDTVSRFVGYDRLYVLFSEGPTEYGAAGQPHLLGYFVVSGSVEDLTGEYGLGPQTAEGIGVGSTVADLRAVYGDGLVVRNEDLLLGPSFFLTDAGGTQLFHGVVTADTDAGRVVSLNNGDFCGL